MDRQTEQSLADFIAEQHEAFDPKLWLTRPHPSGANKLELATAIQFLAMTTFGHERPLPKWYGHQQLLFDLAEKLDPTGLSPKESIKSRIDRSGLEPSRLANMVSAALLHRPK